ncbi:MAG: trypsin-like peptidase domain-containing protein [Elusimicrobia bacterium]|nr:trypsin-like peptidase domain-containing protein [Elusimicrobiota bacterium]
MANKTLLALACAVLFAAPLRALDAEIRVTGLTPAPKGMGTTARPLRVIQSGADQLPALPVRTDLKTVDGALGESSLLTPELLGQGEAGLIRTISAETGLRAALNSPAEAPLKEPGLTEPRAQALPGAKGELIRSAGAPEAAPGGETAADETLGESQRVVFDGDKNVESPAAAPKTVLGRWLSSAGSTLGRGAKRVLPKRLVESFAAPRDASTTDDYGGPKELKLDFKGKLAYGTKWAFNMIGMGALLQYAALAFEKVFSWQLHVSDGILQATGRVELLARLGPKAINTALTSDPFHFLFVQLPMATAWEEFGSRLLGFGVLWTLLAAVRPAANTVSKWLENVPDLFTLRRLTQTALSIAGKVSRFAFPLAATLSAASFAASHFAAWGVSPYFASVHFVMGFSLAYIAYKTRSIVVPFVAHYAYNLLTLTAGLLAAHFLMPMGAQVYTGLLGVAGVVYLFYNFRSHLKARSQAKAQSKLNFMARSGKVVLPLLLAAVTAGSLMGPGYLSRNFNEAAFVRAAQVWPAQDATPVKPAAPDTTAAALAPKADSTAAVDLTVAITAKSKPAVVKIFSGHGLGSGYVVSPDGIVISNAHVTGAAKAGDTLKVEFSDGSTGEIKVLAANHDKDIAILQLPKRADGMPRPFIPLGESNALVEGQQVLAMGYPLGLPFTVTRGIVSGLGGGRGSIYVQQLQTDAAINHGNSGGPLLNMQGEVIGMNTAIAAPTAESGSIGIGFSIVADDIKAALVQYAAAGNINTAWLGVIVNTSNPDSPDQGVLIEKVRPGSPAALAGLKDGDLILGVDQRRFGKGPAGLKALARAIAQHKPGETLSLLIGRQGDVNTFTAKLADEK